MRHVYECQVRWADQDLLGHVNNVVYVDYLQEARVDMLRTHGRSRQAEQLAEGVVVVRTEVGYRAPLFFDFRPVLVECWVTEIRAATFTLAYEVFHERPDGSRKVYLQAATVLTPYVFAEERPRRLSPEEREGLAAYLEPADRAPRVTFLERPATAGRYPVRVRFSDVDVYRHVNNVTYFEYFQEARIHYFEELGRRSEREVTRPLLVVARKEVDYRVPVLHRPEPYDAWSWISRVGNTSFDVQSELCDGDTVLARAHTTVVVVDADAQRPTPPDPAFREVLVAALP
ncbi:acyl-CoA thioesterase [Nocardioides sp. zg-579]|uniref:Acyl-CoA thioesterase n=1 Tax=Nocardioides marmotae TaxID=2663857 RepID=A0A6I3JFY7_9ACTN|nr:thioesterase family protein [Nocardioides marmotae]MCR6033409.1 acyl-CoA thioesterase [Gordonia jinghuaiqii]MTB97067.1 acyl-CoA thioesterase [Nocardioides marmotae]QKE00724.1 acyl-CoA thioesterase [Nocardioides marmotae]